MSDSKAPISTQHQPVGLPIFIHVPIGIAVVLLAVLPTHDPTRLAKSYSWSAYYLFSLLFITWIVSILRLTHAEGFSAASFVKRHAAGILTAALLTSITWVSVEKSLRVLSDETNLACVSRSMTVEKRVDNVAEGQWVSRNFQRFFSRPPGVEKHPLGFPYFAHTIHSFLGYRVNNFFILNHLAFAVVLFLVYWLTVSHWGRAPAVAAQLFVAAQPLIPIAAASGGQDLLAAAFFLLTAAAFKRCVEAPETPERFWFMAATAAILINCRQEMPLVVGVVALISLCFFKIPWARFCRASLMPWFVAAGMIPLLWQRLLVTTPYENSAAETPFSIHHLLVNNAAFLKSLMDFHYFLPYATVVNIAGVGAMLWIAALAIRGRLTGKPLIPADPIGRWVLALTAGLITHWLVITAYFRGALNHPTNARYYIVFVIGLSLLGVWLLSRIKPFAKNPKWLICVGLVLVMFYQPIAAQNRFMGTITLFRDYKYLIDFFDNNGTKNILIITDRPGLLTAHEYGAAGFSFANANINHILMDLDRRVYSDVYVVQRIDYKTNKPIASNKINVPLSLETIARHASKENEYLRISVIVPAKRSRPFPAFSGYRPEPPPTQPK